MKTLLIAAGAASMALTAVPASAQSAHHILRGAGIGAAGGLLAGAVVPGLSMGNGALIGAAAGGLFNTLHHGHRHYYRHNRYNYNYRHHRR